MRLIRTLLFLSTAFVASATSVTTLFTFDSTTTNGKTFNLSASTGSTPDNSLISAYMTGILQQQTGCSTCTVTVTGGFVDTTYNADGNVTGPGATSAPKSLTLGTSDAATASNTTSSINSTYDNFLANTSNSGAQPTGNNNIMMTFTGITISNISFDYEIFPNITCTKLGTGCGTSNSNLPTFEFEAGKNTVSPVTAFGTNGTVSAVAPGTTNGNTDNSPLTTTETAPQYINSWSGSLSSANELDFVDWPATIGVDNVQITWTTTTPSPVPDPASGILFATVLGGLILSRKFRKRAA